MAQLIELRGDMNFNQANLHHAIDLFKGMSISSEFEEFLTIEAYELI